MCFLSKTAKRCGDLGRRATVAKARARPGDACGKHLHASSALKQDALDWGQCEALGIA